MTRRASVYLVLACLVLAILVAGLFALWPSAGDESAPSGPSVHRVTHRAGSFRFRLDVNPEAPRVGENTLTLVLQDEQGQPVGGAAVSGVAKMAAMGAMPAMRAPAGLEEVEPGLYRGTFAPTMAGSWPLTLQIAKEGMSEARVTFDLATGRAGLRLASGAEMVGESSDGPDPGNRVSDQASSFSVDPEWQQAIGVRTAEVGPRDLVATMRLPGRVVVDEARMVDVNLKTAGWIERLLVSETGQYVQAGQRLFDLYSPELVTAQRDLRVAIDNARSLADSPSADARERSASLVDASRRRLQRLGLSEAQVEEVVAGEQIRETLPVLSPSSGYVLEKMAMEGMRVEPGMRLYRIADLSTVWVMVDVYEGDASFVRPGQDAVFTLAYEPGKSRRGRVDYVYPTLERASRSIRIRLEFPNPDLQLRPEMYGDVLLRGEVDTRLAIPTEAVLDLGTRQVVFVVLGNARLQAREVALGPEMDGWHAVLAGISDGDRVVVSGNFLIDAESKVRGVVPLPLDAERSRPPGEPDASARSDASR